ncbi:MAG TPA: malto-oligosyltrehalose synthase, partial [Steroidobacteraceae bacterium]|nr:malto-oligosyltrehalose synthase [Steroidobacteraceae bacterium]
MAAIDPAMSRRAAAPGESGAQPEPRPDAVIPRATYRIQLNKTFTFRDAIAIIPYLADLGISHVYCSPYFRARAGSLHGYDIVDHNSLNPEIGSESDFEQFVSTLRSHGMGHVLDLVPNHVGIMGSDNLWWMDVLENGEASAYADHFDIEWHPANPALSGRVLVPVLAEPYGIALERGELQLRFERESGSLAVFHHEHRLPLDPATYPRVLHRVAASAHRGQLAALSAAFAALPDRRTTTTAEILKRRVAIARLKGELSALCAAEPDVCNSIDTAVRSFAGNPGEPSSFDALHELLEEQPFRIASWRVAADDINYRRFFDVNDLAGLRVENPAVFEATHRLLLELVGAGKIDGLRIDHPDGLRDPAQYFRRLQARVAEVRGACPAPGADFGPASRQRRLPIYLVAEKITASFEHLPVDWPVHGETGYHFANVLNRMLVDGATRARMDRVYQSFVGRSMEWSSLVYEAQHMILRRSLASELGTIATQLARIAQADRRTRDLTLNSLRQALAEVIACFPVYRTYVTDQVSESDRRFIDWAVSAARRRRSAAESPVFDFVRAALLMELPVGTEALRRQVRRFAMKFQQVTAPVTAKGIEDTSLYRFNRLISLNEVGGEPDAYGISVRAYHADSQHRARLWPHEMLATSTHDTKRSEDVRARINVLSEMTQVWRRTIERWSRMNRTRKRDVEGTPAPDPNDEYLFYQTLVGTWPLQDPDGRTLTDYRERLEAYMLKAVREAKNRSSWANVNAEYEEALLQFIRTALEPRDGNLFLADVAALQSRLHRYGLLNGMSQTLCKLTAPGVPDIYQGNELWDCSLVDPDNRRPVDYAIRRELLATMRAQPPPLRELLECLHDGRAKLFLTWKTLQ